MPPRRKRPTEETAAAFLRHVGRGEAKAVTALLAETPALVNAIGAHPFWGGRPQPLHVAIDTARNDMVRLLLRAGADADGSNAEYGGWSPLLVAIVKRRHRARQMLLRAGARVGLVEALAMGDDRRALRLLKRGRAALRLAIPSGGSLLGFARTPKAIDRLLALGVPVDERNQWGTSPVDALSRLGRAGRPLVRHLAARGATVPPEAYARLGDQRSLARLDPTTLADPAILLAAVENGHRALAAWLLERGAHPDARAPWGSRGTSLHSAAWRGDLEMVELLLAHGADRTLLDEEHRNTPAGWAEVSATVTNNPKCLAIVKRLK